jgi:FkbM family methyltransferase
MSHLSMLRRTLRRFSAARACSRLVRRVPKWPRIISRYTRSLGLLHGLGAMTWSTVGVRTVSVRLPNVQQPIMVRPRSSDKFAFEEIFLENDYALEGDLNPELIVDVGANVGYASIYFALRYPRAQIIAIEPEASNFNILQANTKAYPHIKLVQAAIWSQAGNVGLHESDESWAHSVSRDPQLPQVSALTLDDILAMSQASRIDLLKIDIEGAEQEIFEHPGGWLDRTSTMIVELHDRFRPGCSEALRGAIRDRPFSFVQRGANAVVRLDAGEIGP